MTILSEILWRNEGQRLTPELIAGIVRGAEYEPPRFIDIDAVGEASCGRFVFRAERFAQCVDELRPLHDLHWQETEGHRHGLGLAYDYAGMVALERRGALVLFTIRDDGNALVGQCAQRIARSNHTGTLFAEEDALFLRPDCRGGRTAARFIGFMETALAGLGVQECRVSVKHVNSAGRLLEHCGFAPVATQYVKIIGSPQ